MSESLLDLAKIKIQQDYEAEIAQAKAKAKERMEQRLRSATQMFGDDVIQPRKERVKGLGHTKNFQNNELAQLVLDEIKAMTIGTRFTISMLGEQMRAKNSHVIPTAVGTVINRTFRGTQLQMNTDISRAIRNILIEQSMTYGSRTRYGYERCADKIMGGAS